MSKLYALVNGHEYELEDRPNADDAARKVFTHGDGQGLLNAVLRGQPVTVIVNQANVAAWAVYQGADS